MNFYRIFINETSGIATRPAELLIDNEFSDIFPEDFTVDVASTACLTYEYGHIAFLEGVGSDNHPNITAVTANTTGLTHDLTAVKFGITEDDLVRSFLHVMMNGGPFVYGMDDPPQGQLLRYDTAVLRFY